MQRGQTITWMDRDAAPVAEWSTSNGGVDVYDEHGKLVPAYKRVLIDGDAAVAPAPATFKSLPSTCIYASACATSSIPEPAPTAPRYIFVPIPNQPIAPPSPVQQQLPPPPPPQQPPLPPPAPQPLVVPAAAVLHHPPPASTGNWSHHTTYDQEYGNGKARVSSFKQCPPESIEDMGLLEYHEEEEFINRIKSYCETNQFHHTFAFTDNNAATLRVLRPYIPRFLTHPDWHKKIRASSIDEQCFGDLKKKVDDYVYLITISIAKEHVAPWKQMATALFRRCIEQNDFGQLVLYALIFLDSLETRIRDAEDGSEVLIGHYVGMSAAATNAHSRSYDHFNNATPASLLKLILFTIELTNQLLESRQVDYQIKARKTILTSVADLDCARYGTDVVGVLEVVVSMLTDSAIGLPGGMNVAACGMMMNLPQPLTIINNLPHYATIDSLMQLDINSTILPLIPYSIAVLIGSVVFKLKGKFNVDFNTVGDLVTFAKNNPDAFKKHSKEVSGAGTKQEVVHRRKAVGLTRIDSVDYLSEIQVRTFDRSQFSRSLSAEDHLLNSLIQPDRHAPVGSRLHSLKSRFTSRLNPHAVHIYSSHVEGDGRIIGTPRTFKELENSVQAFTVMIRSDRPRQHLVLHLNATCDRDHPEGGAGLCCVPYEDAIPALIREFGPREMKGVLNDLATVIRTAELKSFFQNEINPEHLSLCRSYKYADDIEVEAD